MSTNPDDQKTQLTDMVKAVGAILGVALALFTVVNSIIAQPTTSLVVALIAAALVSAWLVLSRWVSITQVVTAWLALAVVVLAGFVIWPRTMMVEGVIYDTVGNPVRNEQVILFDRSNRRYETKTDAEGYYQFIDVPSGKYRVQVRTSQVEGETKGILVRVVQQNLTVSEITPPESPTSVAAVTPDTPMPESISTSTETAPSEPSNDWNKHPSNPVLSVGDPGSWDENWVIFPSVIKNGSMYMMWYRGVDANGIRRIGLATSTDGVNWTKDRANPILAPGNPGEWDENQIESARVIEDGDTYKMWYTGADGAETKRIGYATSSDGINWIKYPGNPVADVGSDGDWDEAGLSGATVIKDSTTYKMWYTGEDRDGVKQIGYATSTDGIAWTKYDNNPVLFLGAPRRWDDYSLLYPSVLKEGTTYRMWYFGQSESYVDRIGYATSPNGTSWIKHADNPVLGPGAEGEWDDVGVAGPWVILDGGTFKMWFHGWQGSVSGIRIGYAISR